MADNTELNPGAGGDVIAADDVGGVKFQVVKLDIGAGGASSPVVGAMPVSGPVTDAELRASAVPVSGPLTDAQLRAAVVPVSGPVTDQQLRAAPIDTAVTAVPADFWPGYSGVLDSQPEPLLIDPSGGLQVRGAVLTDEGTFRVNFANSSLAVSLGAVSISGKVVTGSGFITNISRDVHFHDYFKLDADGESAWRRVESVDSDTQLTLETIYVGGTSGAASRSLVKPITGAGGSISVASGACTLTSGTTDASNTYVARAVDYAPLVYRAALSVSQRIANQTIFAGLSEENTIVDRWYARFRFDGTVNTVVTCETARNPTTTPSGAEVQSSSVALPNGVTTATSNEYRIEVLTERVVFYFNSIRVAEHTRVIPSQHDTMEASVRITNGTGAASTTSVVVDYITGKNHNKVEVGIFSDNEQIVAQQPDLVPFSYNVAGVIAINTVLLQLDCLRYRLLSLQCTSMGTTGAVTPEWSLDGTNWVTATIATQAGATATSFNAAGLWAVPVFARYFRLRLSTATTAGTTTIQLHAYAGGAGVLPSQTVQGSITATGVAGAAAQGAAASGNPVFTGGVAKTAQPTARTDGQIVAPLFSKVGHHIVQVGQIRDLSDTNAPVTLTTTTETTIVAALAAVFNDLYSLTITNTSATGVRVDLRTVAAGAVVESVWVPATTTIQLNPVVPYRQATVNTAWTAQLSAAVTDVRISARTVRNI